jgi:hypothetical protein
VPPELVANHLLQVQVVHLVQMELVDIAVHLVLQELLVLQVHQEQVDLQAHPVQQVYLV